MSYMQENVFMKKLRLAIAALAGCETCIKAHEASVQQHGLGEDHVHDAVRIAAVLSGAATALRG